MGNVFRFKKFGVDQSGCAMKINTDGVLLAAVATANMDSGRILDIGTGTGVIALMLAQRFPLAQVDAVEIDGVAAERAGLNFRSSDFSSRTTAHHTSIMDYESTHPYDLIVSNPPFFVNDLKNPEVRKGIARHADEQFFDGLLTKAAELLAPYGVFWLILPVKQADWMLNSAASFNLFLCHQIDVCSDESKPVIRRILCLSPHLSSIKKETFYIYQSQGVYTDAYRSLLKDFFLAF